MQNLGVTYLHGRQGNNQQNAELAGRMRYAVMSMDEIKVTLLGSYTDRSEVYFPKNLFRTPFQAGRWLVYF